METAKPKKRYELIDSARGFMILNMIAFHTCYDIFSVFGVDSSWHRSLPAVIWERFICIGFILISGVSLNFSKHPYRKGLILNLCGLIITAATLLFIPEQKIIFGILNLLGCAMILTAALKKPLSKLSPALGFALSAAMFAFTYLFPQRWLGFFSLRLIRLPDVLYASPYLAFLGLKPDGFASADYFPLIPWIFVFIAGYYLFRLVKTRDFDRFFLKGFAPLSFLGRYSLIIYLVHQPVIYAICYAVFNML